MTRLWINRLSWHLWNLGSSVTDIGWLFYKYNHRRIAYCFFMGGREIEAIALAIYAS